MSAEDTTISEELAKHSQLALWTSYCSKKEQLENLTDLVIPLISYFETYLDECHAEDAVCERELIAKIKQVIA